MKKYKNLYILLITISALFACNNDPRWYPTANVEIVSQYEYIDTNSGSKCIQVALLIDNTSDVSITSSTITIKVLTDKHDYLQTVNTNIRILPGGKIVLSASFAYLDSAEQVKQNGVMVYDAFFE
jgi:hypothetical protein